MADDETVEPDKPEPEATVEPELEQPEQETAAESEGEPETTAEPESEGPESERPEPEPQSPPPPPPPPPAEPSFDDVVSQIQAIPIGSFLLSTVSTLASMAYGKLGAGQLDEARGAIDAIRALMPVLEGRIEPGLKRDFDQALANLQLAYADTSKKVSS